MTQLSLDIGKLQGEEKAIYEEMYARRAGRLPGPYIPLLNHPRLANLVEKLGFYLKFESELPRDVYEFIVLSVAQKFKVPFIWLDHINAAKEAGLPESSIDSIIMHCAAVPEDKYAVVAKALEFILEFQSIPQALQEKVIELFGVQGLVEMVVLCGFYQTMGVVNQSFDVPHPSGGKAPF